MDRNWLTRQAEHANWEDQAQRRAVKINIQKPVESSRVRPDKRAVGYRPYGVTPASVETYLSFLEVSPLAAPVFSRGRGLHTSSRYPSPGRRGLAERPRSSPCVRRRENLDDYAKIRNPRRPVTAGRSLTASPPLQVHNASTIDAGLGCGSHDRVPHLNIMAPGRPRRISSRGEYRYGARASANREKKILEKMASLWHCTHNGDKCPTVTALRTAVAAKALQEKLCEYRTGKGAASALKVQTHARRPSQSFSRPRKKGGKSQPWIEPWDNRSPFICNQGLPPTSSMVSVPTRPASARALRKSTCDDPLFKKTDRQHRQHSVGLLTLSRKVEATALLETPTTASRFGDPAISSSHEIARAHHVASKDAAANNAVAAAAAVARDEMRNCFRRLTVGTLIELNHLTSPPRPVRAVMTALACLLGWQQKRSRYSPPRSLFSNAYALRDTLSSIHPERISGRRLLEFAKLLGVNDAIAARVKGASTAAGVLLDWLLAVLACARAEADERGKPGARQAAAAGDIFGSISTIAGASSRGREVLDPRRNRQSSAMRSREAGVGA